MGSKVLREGVPFPPQADLGVADGRQTRKDVLLIPPIKKVLRSGEVQRRRRAVLDVELADGDEPIALGERQPAENDRVHHGEDRGRRTDAQRQHHQRHARERRCPSQRTDGMARVAPEQVEPDRADLTHGLRHLCQTTEIAQRHPSRFDGRYPAGDVRLDLLLDVKSQLVVDFGTDSAPSSDSANIGDESCEHAGTSALTEWSACLQNPLHGKSELLPTGSLGVQTAATRRRQCVDSGATVVL